MNYPVWELHTAGGGLLIACMAVVHVYVAHFAVGGGLFLVWAEMKAYRESSPLLLDYVKAHAKFFLLLTMVFGGITGVGIWFTIALLNPSATSTLIHTFVFGWATEWVCFLGEIIALFIYFYTFGTISEKAHLKIGWLYFIFAWLSLFLINGIIDFMLTPGQWAENGSFWSGFFNPTMWPALCFRTFIAFMFAGIFGFLTSMFITDDKARTSMNQSCALWMIIPMALMLVSGYWYFNSLPLQVQAMVLKISPEFAPYFQAFFLGTGLLFTGAVLLALSLPLPVKKVLAFLILAMGLVYMGGFEFIREGGRRPWAIYGHTYANAVQKAQVEKINRDGFLASATWIFNKKITPETKLAAGRELWRHQCAACHSVGGPMKDILELTKGLEITGIESRLDGNGKLSAYMPPFMGTPEERRALAAYILEGLHARKQEPVQVFPAQDREVKIPPFDPDNDEYVLLAWNNLGMHCISDSDPFWVLLPPANDLFALLVRRGETPEIVTEDIEITYEADEAFKDPSAHVKFWDHAQSVFGKKLEKNIGLSGNGLSGKMHFSEERNAYEATLIPVVPYRKEGRYDPYPLFTVKAVDKATGNTLAVTRTVAPTSTEMGCKNCHGGQWRVDGKAGFTDETAANILAVHDRRSGTNLLERAEQGNPQLCQSCHGDPVLGTEGKPGLLNFPAAIHGWHANYLSKRGADACYKCHPARPEGPTQCLRGVHAGKLDCTACHGYLEDHALSLLKKEDQANKAGAQRLMAHLEPRKVAALDEINARTPWINEPDCLGCHVEFTRPDPKTADAFNKWTEGPDALFRMRHDETYSIMCMACHGATHAVYPAKNKLGADLDNIQPLQYQKNRFPMGYQRCSACHTVPVEDEPIHHPMAPKALVQDK
ncbi:MAG: cytochrome ubiquinol oxidase subunit I [Desulfobacter sp.]|nr:MAG: cytochrome ubiquinol oxidase subunit I [Desulfobacter sp.]